MPFTPLHVVCWRPLEPGEKGVQEDPSAGLQRRDHAADLLDQTKCVGYPMEAVMLVERGGVLVKSVDHHEACRDELSGGNHTGESIGQEGTAEALALKICIDREAGQQDCGHLGRAATTDALGQVVTDQAVSRERVVPHDHILIGQAPHKGSGDPPGLRPGCLISQPGVEGGLTRIQGVKLMPRGVEWLGTKDHCSGWTDDVAGPLGRATQGRRRLGRCLQGGDEIVVERGGHSREGFVLGQNLLGALLHR